MRPVSTNDRRDYILYDAINGSQSKPIAGLKYLDDNSVEQWFQDVKSLSVSLGVRNKQYGKFTLMPPSFSMGANIDNKGEKYSPGGSLDGVLELNRKVYPYFGYMTADAVASTSALTPASFVKLYHAAVSGSNISSDASNVDPVASSFMALPGITGAWTMYDIGYYDGGYYAPAGYYLSEISSIVQEYKVGRAYAFSITSTGAGHKVYARAADQQSDLTGNVTEFELIGTCAVGANTFSFPSAWSDKNYVQFCVVFYDATYGASYVTGMNMVFADYSEIFEQGEYLMDDPSFSSSLAAYAASFSARDNLKRALETKINTSNIATSAGTDIAAIIREIAKRAKLPYSVTTVPDTTYIVSVADGYKNTQASIALEECLQYLNSFATYRLWIDADGYLTLGIKQTDLTGADWVVDYRYNASGLTKSKSSDNLLQRVIVHDGSGGASLSTNAETELDTATYNTAGAKTLTWVGEAVRRRWEITVNSGDAVVAYMSNTLESMTFTITGTTIDVTITVYGCALTSVPTAIFEEFSGDNMDNGVGMTYEMVNRYISASDAEDMAARLIAGFATTAWVINAEIPLNPILEINDRVLVLEKHSGTKNIYVIESISHSFEAKGAAARTRLSLRDIGFSYAYYIWDRGDVSGYDDMLYDNGFVFDYDLIPATSDTTDYTNTKEVQAA